MVAPLTAQQTRDRARAIMQSGRGAALPELLKIIETLSLNICEVTISELAELIEKDAVVLAKIIAVANTLAHNPGISALTTLSQAIHQLGYNRIRTIAVSLMLLDHEGDANPPEQREAAAQALCAGLLAQSTAEALGTHDPEFVFACAALRNLGRIILASVSPEHCREAIRRAVVVGEPAGYRSQFGLSPLELTRHLLAEARLPPDVLDTLRESEPESLASVSTTYDARLFGIIDYSSRLASLSLDARHGPDGFVKEMRRLSQRFEQLVPGASDIAKPALQRTDERLRSFTRCAGVRGLPTHSLSRIDWRLRQLSPHEVAPEAPPDTTVVTSRSRAPSADLPRDEPAAPTAAPLPWSPTASEPAPFGSPGLDHHAPVDLLLNALTLARSAVNAQEVWIFAPTSGEAGFSFLRGIGPSWPGLPRRVRLETKERSVFGVCLQRREVVIIHDTSDKALAPYLPDWFRRANGAPSAFALIPVGTADTPSALLLIGWGTPRRVALTASQLALIHQILGTAPLEKPVAAG